MTAPPPKCMVIAACNVQFEPAEEGAVEATFLVGAGVSVAVGMPSTSQITHALLRNPDFGIHSSGDIVYQPCEASSLGIDFFHRDDVHAFQEFLRLLHRRIRFGRLPHSGLIGPSPNYEDIYYVVHALHEHLAEEWDPLAEEYWLQSRDSLPKDLRSASRDDKAYWLKRCLVFIRGAVAGLLLHAERKLGGLSALRAFGACARDVSKVRVFTLNHDTVLERYFHDDDIPLFNGLGHTDGQMQWLEPDHYETSDKAVDVFKLHGSVTWSYWRCDAGGIPFGRFGCSPNNGLLPEDASGRPYSRGDGPDPNPIILVGTLNKAGLYQWQPFLQLLGLFVSCLNTTDGLIVCGHSFGDRFIRGHLANWMRGDPSRRIVLVDPHANAIAHRLGWTVFADRLSLVEKGIQAVTWEEIKGRLL